MTSVSLLMNIECFWQRSTTAVTWVNGCIQLHKRPNFCWAMQWAGKRVQRHLSEQGYRWNLNPLHASHIGGSWECMIGVARSILHSILLQQKTRLTQEVLCTLMVEVTAIMNARPLLSVCADPQPFIFSPSMLLTQKAGVPPPPGDFSDIFASLYKTVETGTSSCKPAWRQKWRMPSSWRPSSPQELTNHP